MSEYNFAEERNTALSFLDAEIVEGLEDNYRHISVDLVEDGTEGKEILTLVITTDQENYHNYLRQMGDLGRIGTRIEIDLTQFVEDMGGWVATNIAAEDVFSLLQSLDDILDEFEDEEHCAELEEKSDYSVCSNTAEKLSEIIADFISENYSCCEVTEVNS